MLWLATTVVVVVRMKGLDRLFGVDESAANKPARSARHATRPLASRAWAPPPAASPVRVPRRYLINTFATKKHEDTKQNIRSLLHLFVLSVMHL